MAHNASADLSIDLKSYKLNSESADKDSGNIMTRRDNFVFRV
jgi:hypothetical protein